MRAKRGTVDSALVYKAKGPRDSIPGGTEKLYTLAPLSEGKRQTTETKKKNIFYADVLIF